MIKTQTKTGKPFSGVCRSYYEDGSLEREVRFQDGKEDGESVTLYKPNAEGKQIMMVKVNHKMGVPEGTWDFFFELLYKNGTLRSWSHNRHLALQDIKKLR